MDRKEAIGRIVNHCQENGISVIISRNQEILLDGSACGGYFCPTARKLEVAAGNSHYWFSILIHEYCHFLQYLEGYFTDRRNKHTGDFFRWVSKEVELDRTRLLNSTREIQKVELECEKRVVDLIRDWNLDIDVEQYILEANAYILSYEISRRRRRWYSGEPHVHPVVLEAMPTKFITRLGYVPRTVMKIYHMYE